MTAAEQKKIVDKETKKDNDECFSFLKDVRDKQKRRPSDPDYDKRTIFVPNDAWKTFTPFEKQFWQIKQNHYDTVLFFQKGKFFELYENDATIGHEEFDLKLTERVKMRMVGSTQRLSHVSAECHFRSECQNSSLNFGRPSFSLQDTKWAKSSKPRPQSGT